MLGVIVLSEDVPNSLKSDVDSKFMIDLVGPEDNKRIIILFKPKSIVDYDQNCGKSRKCYGNSKCIKFPYSTEEQCQCPPGYDGTNCNERSNTTFSSTLDTLMSETAKVPQVSDVYFELQDSREEMRNGFADVGLALTKMTKLIKFELKKVQMNMDKQFKIQEWNTKYSQTITNIETKLDSKSGKIIGLFDENSVQNADPVKRKNAEWAAQKLIKDGILEEWQIVLENMFTGKSRLTFGAPPKPLMVSAIEDLYKEDACTPTNKEKNDQLYRKFTLLQYELTQLYASADFLTGGDPTTIRDKYKETVAFQVCVCIFMIRLFIHFI